MWNKFESIGTDGERYELRPDGCGRIAANHIKAAIGSGLHLSAVCDVKPEAMEALLAKHGFAGDTSIKRRIEYDIFYIENWTMSFDIKIMFLTIFKGFINKNAY